MNYVFLQQLLAECATYEQEHPTAGTADLGHFARWLSLRGANGVGEEAASTRLPEWRPGEEQAGETLDSVISKLLIFMTRYAKLYSKKALAGSPLGSLDEFVYLIALLYEPTGLSKTELIRRSRLEKPAGMEVIRRLLVAGWVTQHDDPDDRRSTRLQLTPAGQGVTFSLFEKMGQMSRVVSGNLSTDEKIQLVGLLEKLEAHHQRVLGEGRDLPWGELLPLALV